MYVQLRYEILRQSVNIHCALGIRIAPKTGATVIYHCAVVLDGSILPENNFISLRSAIVKHSSTNPPESSLSSTNPPKPTRLTTEIHRPLIFSHYPRAARLRILIRLPV